jgi:hypothetical protein
LLHSLRFSIYGLWDLHTLKSQTLFKLPKSFIWPLVVARALAKKEAVALLIAVISVTAAMGASLPAKKGAAALLIAATPATVPTGASPPVKKMVVALPIVVISVTEGRVDFPKRSSASLEAH